MMSMYQSSTSMPGYSAATSWHSAENMPSVFFMMLALVTTAT